MTKALVGFILFFSLAAPFLVLAASEPSLFSNWWGPVLSCTGNYAGNPAPGGNGAVTKTCQSLCDLLHTLQNAVYLGMKIALFVITPLFILYGGFRILIAGASPSGIEEGKKIITSTFKGILLVLGAFVIINTFIYVFNVRTGTGEAEVGWPTIQCKAPPPPPTSSTTVTPADGGTPGPTVTPTTPSE